MSNITFLIGNGFDLACGIKSRYTDTYDKYVRSESTSETIAKFKKTIKKNINSWAEFEMKLVEYAREFSSENELVECIRDYTVFLNQYLKDAQQDFLASIGNNHKVEAALRKSMLTGLTEFYTGLTQNDIRVISPFVTRNQGCLFHFISFNYTTVFDHLVSALFNEADIHAFTGEFDCSEVNHIHGRIDSDVVLGADNDSQLVDLPYSLSRRGKRNILKPVFLENYDDYRMKKAQADIERSSVICVFGLSLGESDLTWRKTIAKWLLKDPLNQLVFFKHSLSSKKYPLTAITQKMDDEEDAKDQLLEMLFGNELSLEERERVYQQTHVPTGFRIFDIKEKVKEYSDDIEKYFIKNSMSGSYE